MKVAKVVVDVPVSSIDSLFDYEIPDELLSVVKPGVRVVVPFGPRKIMGFVIDITGSSEFEKLKPIHTVMDYAPVLTPELLNLSKWLQEETLCFRVSALQAMLPAVFKAKYEKEVWLLADESELPFEWQIITQGREVFPFNELEESGIKASQISSLVSEGLIEIKYVVKGKNRVKKDTYIEIALEQVKAIEVIEGLGKQAKKQKQVLEYLIDTNGEIRLKQLMDDLGVTRAPIKTLEDKGIIRLVQKEVYRDPHANNNERTKPLPLTEQQQQVIEPVLSRIDENKHEMFLLHGVTGSGKTEVYLQSIDRVLQEGKEAIVLVPEISLTPQMVERFKSRFGDDVAVLHSGLSTGEKYDEWRKIHRKEVKVVVGARSAVFAPFEKLGIIIIDEEHETTYKQEDYPKYHAREVAKYRGQYHKCPVILGSATPTLESYARAQKGVYQLLELSERVNEQALPHMEIVDMRKELEKGNRTMFSDNLVEKINDRIKRGEQVVLMLNRRGYSTFVMCRECGETVQCEHCDISMTYHRTNHKLKCHYCSDEKPMPNQCPKCESEAIRFFGTGTQKVEEALQQQFEHARIIRMDVDTTSRKGAHERLLKKFGNQEADILLGTQMIAKGLDFENVTLVGVIAADAILHLPDFRAAEKSFQLLTQVSGRAGRHELPGEVVVQTYTPEHYTVELAAQYDYESFFNREMQIRRRFAYPPYYFLVLINISHENHVKVVDASQRIANMLSQRLGESALLMGPSPSPMLRIKDRFRYQCMIKYKSRQDVDEPLEHVLNSFQKEMNKEELQLTVDFEPYYFM
ncbi:primosomal protein N' [Alkalibacillus haloalkaliphilus]|uniref:primosomal protein N' n=1 Tax=Alkalibacillus haloalkaliphilus TaxID=94136 RepID=UPI002935741F|nr:primosomal protein N' [Alkalibacillus haloalkaliphilus]MDV2582591.1 primosomal protein N' [Alkalibacillus haloalkaliphilus]